MKNKSKVEKVRTISYTKMLCISLYVLSGICFMIYTTETLPKASAEGDSSEDLGYGINTTNASVTVGTACTFSANVTNPHTSTISNGLSSNNIGTTILNTTCNDSGGYAVYAIGYTNEEYGNTSLTYASLDSTPENPITNSNYDIPTGTATSGNTSSWAMKLDTVSGTTTATIEADTNGSFSNYHIIPDDYTKVATLNTVTDNATASPSTGSSISTTYSAYISPTQAPGTYTGKVKYTLVHPSTAPAPEKPPVPYMQTVSEWRDYYLPNVNDTIQAIDNRDGKSYWVAKLADGNIWMTQNLDFDIVKGGADLDSTNTDVPVDWPDAGKLADTYKSLTWDSSNTTPESYDPGTLYWDGVMINDQITCEEYDGTWDSTYKYCPDGNPTSSVGDNHYYLGNYYNWTAAVAMSDSSAYTTQYQDVNQSICPVGWMLPKGGNVLIGSGSFRYLVNQSSLTAGASGNIHINPTYFTYGGNIRMLAAVSFRFIGVYGYYPSSIVINGSNVYALNYGVMDASINSEYRMARSWGNPVRCVARPE